MTTATLTYNPYKAAFNSAYTALSCPEAQAYFSGRAMADMDKVLTVINAVYTVANFVYQFGAAMGQLHYNAVAERYHCPVYTQPRLAPAAPEEAEPASITIDTELPELSPEEAVEIDEAVSQFVTDADLEAVESYWQAWEEAQVMNKKQLLAECKARGIQASSRLRKGQILDLLFDFSHLG